ncbi:MAG: response regulator, partial [Bdellovibrionales bacterium]|nr:response regulator [Bdellovibrionales bacterium]
MESILVLEDDQVFRVRLARAFRERGLAATEASNLSEMQTELNNNKFNYAVIDLKLGVESGLEALRLLKDSQPSCKALILTGFGTISAAVSA